jgi:hypothetical protein
MRYAKIVTRHSKIVTLKWSRRQVRAGKQGKRLFIDLQKSSLLTMTSYDSLIIYGLFLILPSTVIHNNIIYIIYRVSHRVWYICIQTLHYANSERI